MDRKYLVTAVALAALAGCESDEFCSIGTCPLPGSVGGGPTGSGGTAVLTSDNAVTALREGWFAATATADVPFFVVATGIGDTSGGLAGQPGVASKVAPGIRIQADPFGPDTYNCPVSGTFTVMGDVADPNTVTTDDYAEYSSSACDSGTGFTVDGDHRIDILQVVGDPNSGSYEQTQTLTFGDWMAADQTTTVTLSGDHTGTIDSTASNNVSMSFSGNSLIIGEGNLSITIQTYGGFVSADTVSPFDTSLSGTGIASSSAVQGSLEYEFPETFMKPIGEPPTDGIFAVLGNGSTARVSVVDQTLVRVQLDGNNSGNFEISVDTTWDDFLNGTIDLTTAIPVGE
ncbi:MAG: hypothetical protein R3358_07385 [Woeseiaceae bacterium]|nr:hypothetical protein [Woeseiaceae bacterium]